MTSPDREECVHWLGSVPENSSSHRFTAWRLWCWEVWGFLPSTGASVEICTTTLLQYVAFNPFLHTKQKILFVLHSHSLWLNMLSKTREFWLRSPDVPLERRKAQSKLVSNKLQRVWNIRPEQTNTHFLRWKHKHTQIVIWQNVNNCYYILWPWVLNA